jgi:hypothetical protein
MTRRCWPIGVLLALAACGSRSELAEELDGGGPLPDAGLALDVAAVPRDATAVDGGCAGLCGIGQVCVHEYYTHDPPPPLPDGGVCTFGTKRYSRCWSVTDRCDAVPQGCVTGASCSCPALVGMPGLWPRGCECQSDGTLNCYDIGI